MLPTADEIESAAESIALIISDAFCDAASSCSLLSAVIFASISSCLLFAESLMVCSASVIADTAPRIAISIASLLLSRRAASRLSSCATASSVNRI